MPTVWFSLMRSLHCKSEPSDVHNPKTRKQLSTILTRKAGRSGCSRSIANLKDVIHGSKRHLEKPPSCSPRSIGSSEFLNPITHEVILSNSRCELKITGFGGFQDSLTNGGNMDANGGGGGGGSGGGSTFVGTLRPGTPGPGGHPTMHYFNPSFRNSSATTPRKSPFLVSERKGSRGNGHSSNRVPLDADSNGSFTVTCHKCGEQFNKWEAAETHHLSKHAVVKHSPSLAVTELVEGDSSRKIVEIICRTSWLKSENHCGRIERVLKVHNMQKTLARFEDYREMVKIKASKLPKKHPRCIADGNELLRFYGTTVACSLGLNGSSSLCISEKCCVCRIIRNGFSAKKELKEGLGVFTTSTSGRAFESIQILEDDPSIRKALIVCRVIAGRVHRPLENIQEMAGQTGFDSLAGKVGLYSNIEELYLLNPRALLPCFVVICKP
ncbi:Transcription factor [Gossypium australe]|uniref:Transcription factor n=1 Tax=Gossypium australe TaxID=47621 RepID=A0A5B6VEQ9_9ROSI|nr:Transcription factor [Gossypium australe]